MADPEKAALDVPPCPFLHPEGKGTRPC